MRIAVYGSSTEDARVSERARTLGAVIAGNGHTIVTGACNGIPQEAVRAAVAVGGKAVGFSAYPSEEKQRAAGAPIEGFQEIIYIPADFPHKDNERICMKYRNVTSVAYVDAAVIIAGRIGTLNEFTNAHDMEKHIGVLKGSGGVADDIIPVIVEKVNKPSKATITFEEDPEKLIAALERHYGN